MELKRKLDYYLGFLLTMFIIPLSFRKGLFRHTEIRNIKKILVIKLSGIGDYALLLPTLLAIKKEFMPERFLLLTFQDSNFEFIDTHVFDQIIHLDKKKLLKGFYNALVKIRNEKLDLVIDFTFSTYISAIFAFSCRARFSLGYGTMGLRRALYDYTLPFQPHRHTSEIYYDAVRFLAGDPQRKSQVFLLKLPYDKRFIEHFFKTHSIEESQLLVGIHPCSMMSQTNKRHWILERYIILAKRLIREFNAKVIFTGTENEGVYLKSILQDKISENAIFCFNLSLPEFLSLIANYKLFIAIDSGPMHIASLMGIPTLGIFGPDTPLRFVPLGPEAQFVYRKTKCSPCAKSYKGIWKRCNDMECMKAISVDEVFEKAAKLLMAEKSL